jgi:hypothetical protein
MRIERSVSKKRAQLEIDGHAVIRNDSQLALLGQARVGEAASELRFDRWI